jgi:hypothetical protein
MSFALPTTGRPADVHRRIVGSNGRERIVYLTFEERVFPADKCLKSRETNCTFPRDLDAYSSYSSPSLHSPSPPQSFTDHGFFLRSNLLAPGGRRSQHTTTKTSSTAFRVFIVTATDSFTRRYHPSEKHFNH